MKVLKAEGAVALEPHIENPDSSAIFAEYPPILKDEGLLHLVTDTIRLLVVSSSNLSPYAVEEVMDQAIKTHHHGELKPAEALASMAGALPALGIVACVLGVVKTMGAIDQPPPVLGALIGHPTQADHRRRRRDLQSGQADHHRHHARPPPTADH